MTVWDDFLAVLKKENQILRELIDLSVEKQKHINNAQEVSRVAGEEQKNVKLLEAIDKERAELFDVLSLGKSLEDWLASLDSERQDEVAPLLLDLTESLGRLQSLNDLNQELLAQSLSYVHFSLNLLMGDDTSPTYARPGGSTAGKSIFDRKV